MNYWGMKTFKSWANDFIKSSYIGIDQYGIDADFRSLQEDEIEDLINQDYISWPIVRNFRQFVFDMQIGDIVVVGIGKMTKYNVKSIVKIIGNYKFSINKPYARHWRKVEIIENFDTPIPYMEFSRMARIELLSKQDFTDVNSKIYK